MFVSVYCSLVVMLVTSYSIAPSSRPRVSALQMAFTRDLVTRLNSGGMTGAIARDLRRCIFIRLALLLLLSYEWLLYTGLGIG